MGIIATGFLLLGRRLLGKENTVGWLFAFGGDVAWMAIGFSRSAIDLALTGMIMAILDLDGWVKWRRRGKYWNSIILPENQIRWWQIWR